jgi:CHAT domain-containing protein/predicted negative regulator of RcsB-dependent stress response
VGIRRGRLGAWLGTLTVVVCAVTYPGGRLGAARQAGSVSAAADRAVAAETAGAAAFRRGELHAARTAYEQALSIRDARSDSGGAITADLLQLTAISIRLQEISAARDYLERAQRHQDPTSADDRTRARVLELRGAIERWEAQYPESLHDLDAAIELRRRRGAEGADDIGALETRGDVLLLMGDVVAAQRAWTAALDLARRTVGENDASTADIVRKLGLAEFSLGNLAEARRLRERALAIGEAALGPCDRILTGLMQSAAISRQYDGEYAAARALLRRARRTMDSCSAKEPRPPDAVATIIYNEAALEDEVGDLAAAERLYGQAIAAWQKGFGPNHPTVARGIDALADVVSRRGDHARAMTLYRRALAIRRQSLGRSHPQVSWTLANVAATEMTVGRVTAAWRDINEAIATYRQSGTSDEPDHLARMLELRGRLSAARGDLAGARQSLQEALSERERVFGEAHPLTSETRATLAEMELAGGDRRDAVNEALAAERNGRDHLRFTLRYLPERQALMYAARRTHALDLLVSAAPPAVALEQVVQSRGVLLDEFAARARVAASAPPDARALLAAAQTARERFANLVMRSFSESVDRKLIDSARERKDEAERALAERSASARAEAARTAAGLEQVRRALPPGSAMVSYVRYDRLDPDPRGRTAPERLASYAAFIVRADDRSAAPVFVPLGAAATIDRVIRAWKLAVGSGGEYQTVGVELRAKVWDPVASHLRGVARTFIVPDGLINVINFAALPTAGGRFLVEEPMVLHYLSTERDVLLSATDAAPTSARVVGRPAFDDASSRRGAAVERAAVSPCEQPGLRHFTDLPGTEREAEDIARLWTAQRGATVELLTGSAATEGALKRAMAGRRVVHLATHGFFLRGGCDDVASTGTRSVGAVVVAPATQMVAENPLLLSGLAFAGANRPRPRTADQDDGILTAEEIAGLNLQGTEWAVLSACDTGLGEIRAGEGVFGLRRAFHIAGARTVIMSLWSVDDQATRSWMRALYEARLMQHLDTADAVRQASLTVLKQRRAARQSTHPFFWAAFVAAGDWR